MTLQFPVLGPNLKEYDGTLVSTGCAEELCVVGQVSHTHEPRVGGNRTVEVVEQEAEDFLRELYNDELFASETNLQDRLQQARTEIRNGSVGGLIYETQENGIVGGTWTQTSQELEFGIRWAWRNARRCIMRSYCEDLRLCDLRSVKCSNEMAVELVKGLTEAYNGGDIIPTVFVFPPQTTNSRGPMIWNDRILSFAAYETEDGTILGDPENTQLTKDIMELGWVPPQPRSRWDVLPVVVMAKDQEPFFVELPANLRRLVKIRHPRYEAAFGKLDLKWVAFPAFSRLGFDIGGVQYTAAPFIGWFMDTEIGVRGLADPLRYNVLPDLVKALYFSNPIPESTNAFEHLPKYEQLVMLSRAQIELNYAIYYSFLQDGITISDTLSASKKWARYNDEFEKKNGYSLPSDPYWLPSSQSSVVPTWRSEGTLGYQSKPLICRNVQDPVTIWRTEKSTQTSKNATRSINGQISAESLGTEWKTHDTTQDESIPATPEDMAEPGPPVPGIGSHLNYDDLTPGVPSLLDMSQDNIESPSVPPTDNLSPSHYTELDSLASSWAALVDSDTTSESNYSINMDNPFPPDDGNSLSSSWETLVEPMAKMGVISITSTEKSLPSSDVDSLSSHWDPSTELVANLISSPSTTEDIPSLSYRIELEPWDPLDIAGQQQDSGPLLIPDRPPTPKRPRSNSLSTIDEETEEYEEEAERNVEGGHDMHVEERGLDEHIDMQEVDVEGVARTVPETREVGLELECEVQESQDIERAEGSTIQTVETNPKVPVQSEPDIPPSKVTSNHDVGDSNLNGKVERENESPPPETIIAEEPTSIYNSASLLQNFKNQVSLLESTASEGTSTTSEAPAEYLQQYELPIVIRTVWPVIHIPTLHVYAGTLRGPNPFTLENPIKIISGFLKQMYSHLLQPYKTELVPRRRIHNSPHGRMIALASRSTGADSPADLDSEFYSGSALEDPPFASTSKDVMNSRQAESRCPTDAINLPPTPNAAPDSLSNSWDIWELTTEIYLRAKNLAESVHSMIQTAHPFNNLKALFARGNYHWLSTHSIYEALQLATKTLHHWARRLVRSRSWRRITLVVRSSSVTIIDLLLVYLAQLRTRWGGP